MSHSALACRCGHRVLRTAARVRAGTGECRGMPCLCVQRPVLCAARCAGWPVTARTRGSLRVPLGCSSTPCKRALLTPPLLFPRARSRGFVQCFIPRVNLTARHQRRCTTCIRGTWPQAMATRCSFAHTR
eukprot:365639-Chlamydomonas_euryale.AAC.7